MPVTFRAEDSPRGLWRSLGKRVGCKPSRVRIPHPPPGEKWTLTCGNAVRSDRPGTSSHQISRPLVSVLVSVSGRRFARKHGPPTSRGVRRRSTTCASPNQPAAKASWDARRSNIGSRNCSDQRPLCLDSPPTPRAAPWLRVVVDPLRHGSADLGGGPSHAPGSREWPVGAGSYDCTASHHATAADVRVITGEASLVFTIYSRTCDDLAKFEPALGQSSRRAPAGDDGPPPHTQTHGLLIGPDGQSPAKRLVQTSSKTE
jgi:hypothetical protein